MVNPEEEFGRRFANRLINRHVISDMPLGEDLHLTELAIPPAMQSAAAWSSWPCPNGSG